MAVKVQGGLSEGQVKETKCLEGSFIGGNCAEGGCLGGNHSGMFVQDKSPQALVPGEI